MCRVMEGERFGLKTCSQVRMAWIPSSPLPELAISSSPSTLWPSLTQDSTRDADTRGGAFRMNDSLEASHCVTRRAPFHWTLAPFSPSLTKALLGVAVPVHSRGPLVGNHNAIVKTVHTTRNNWPNRIFTSFLDDTVQIMAFIPRSFWG